MKILLIILSLVPMLIYAQEKNNLTFNVEYNRHQFAMEQINSYLSDTNYFSTNVFSGASANQVNRGNNFAMSISYQPNSIVDFGFYGSYQNSKLYRTPYFYEDLDPIWNPGQNIVTHEGDYEFSIESLCLGLTSTIFLNKILKFEQKNNNLLNRILLGVNFKGGIGFAETHEEYSYPTIPFMFSNGTYSAKSFHGQLGLRLGYIISKKSIFSAVGINIGYQFFKTPNIKNKIGQDIVESANYANVSANLDFSGLYGGLYLTIGK